MGRRAAAIIFVLGCGDVESFPQGECEDAKAHVETCELPDFEVSCELENQYRRCDYACMIEAPCGAFTGDDPDARHVYYDCSGRCACWELRDFADDCGHDTSDVICTGTWTACPCAWLRDCDAQLDWIECVRDNPDTCGG
jgi:hypothetical protein